MFTSNYCVAIENVCSCADRFGLMTLDQVSSNLIFIIPQQVPQPNIVSNNI